MTWGWVNNDNMCLSSLVIFVCTIPLIATSRGVLTNVFSDSTSFTGILNPNFTQPIFQHADPWIYSSSNTSKQPLLYDFPWKSHAPAVRHCLPPIWHLSVITTQLLSSSHTWTPARAAAFQLEMLDGFLMDWKLPMIRQSDSRGFPAVHAVGAQWHRGVMCAKARRKVSPGVLFLLRDWGKHIWPALLRKQKCGFHGSFLSFKQYCEIFQRSCQCTWGFERNRFSAQSEKLANSVGMCDLRTTRLYKRPLKSRLTAFVMPLPAGPFKRAFEKIISPAKWVSLQGQINNQGQIS